MEKVSWPGLEQEWYRVGVKWRGAGPVTPAPFYRLAKIQTFTWYKASSHLKLFN